MIFLKWLNSDHFQIIVSAAKLRKSFFMFNFLRKKYISFILEQKKYLKVNPTKNVGLLEITSTVS